MYYNKCIVCGKELNFFNKAFGKLKTKNNVYGLCNSCYRSVWNAEFTSLYREKNYRAILEGFKDSNILTHEFYLNEIASFSAKLNPITGYIAYNIDDFVLINEKSSKIMINQQVYDFSDIIGYEEGDDAVVYDVQGPEVETTSSKRHGLTRAVVGGMVAGPVGAAVGGLTGRKNTVVEKSGNVSYSTTVHEFVLRVHINSLSKPIETLCFHDDENGLREVAILLDRILSMAKS